MVVRDARRGRLTAVLMVASGFALVVRWAALRSPWNLVILEDDVAPFLLAVALVLLLDAVASGAQWRTWWAWRRDRRAARAALPRAVRIARRILGFVVGCAIVAALPLLLIGYYGTSGWLSEHHELADERSGLTVIVDVTVLESVCGGGSVATVRLHDDRGLLSRRVVLERNEPYDCLGYEAEFPERGVVVLDRDCERVTISYDPSDLDVLDRHVEPAPCHSASI